MYSENVCSYSVTNEHKINYFVTAETCNFLTYFILQFLYFKNRLNITFQMKLLLISRIFKINSIYRVQNFIYLFIFDVLLAVHLSIYILVINQLDAQNFCFTISLFHASTCFENMCSKHVEV